MLYNYAFARPLSQAIFPPALSITGFRAVASVRRGRVSCVSIIGGICLEVSIFLQVSTLGNSRPKGKAGLQPTSHAPDNFSLINLNVF